MKPKRYQVIELAGGRRTDYQLFSNDLSTLINQVEKRFNGFLKAETRMTYVIVNLWKHKTNYIYGDTSINLDSILSEYPKSDSYFKSVEKKQVDVSLL